MPRDASSEACILSSLGSWMPSLANPSERTITNPFLKDPSSIAYVAHFAPANHPPLRSVVPLTYISLTRAFT